MTDHCLEESRGLSGGTPQGLPACPPPSAECLERSRGGLSLNHLKAVAVAAMVIDHIAFAFVPDGTLLAILLHSIGKITGPTMFFAAVEGCHHTRNLNRYLLRLAVFALVSWFPFLYFHFGGALAAIQLMRPKRSSSGSWAKISKNRRSEHSLQPYISTCNYNSSDRNKREWLPPNGLPCLCKFVLYR